MHGLGEHLRRLMKAGVWISSEEFKGTKPVRRGSVDFEITPEGFDDQILTRGVGVSTGGTSGRPVKTKLDLDFLNARSHYDRIMFEILGVRDQPMALWYPALPASTGIGNILRYARNGIVPKRWFEIPAAGSGMQGLESRLATFLIVRITGGEPLLNMSGLTAITECCATSGIKCGINTNRLILADGDVMAHL